MKQLVIGILAHVDAGKTTLSEAILYKSGTLRKLGRVDHQNAFLDTFSLERERGITIFSKQAIFSLPDANFTLLDTPGHVDFSAETERTLSVLDYAVLLISGTDGVQSHTRTLWRLLERYKVPTFIFINKMDLPGADREKLIFSLNKELSSGCIDFSNSSADVFQEKLAETDEAVLEKYLGGEKITNNDIAGLINDRKVFPIYFGAALHLEGIEDLLQGLSNYTVQPKPANAFSARAFKVSRDENKARMTYVKVTGGVLKVRETIKTRQGEEKVNAIRIYNGAKFQQVEQLLPGQVGAVTGLSSVRPGDGLGLNAKEISPVLEPVLNYRLILPEGTDSHTMLTRLRELEDEDPQLRVEWNENINEIQLQVMGEIQLEVLERIILDRFGVKVAFDTGNIVYKETIESPVIGIGHFEPLRHYAEVHLLLEPGERGSGITIRSLCDTSTLAVNWQRLIMTHIGEKLHRGTAIGAPLTDVCITILTGRAHIKHTEGGDFREATYRAIRNGLMQVKSVLLEPQYQFRLELPMPNLGRAMNDIQLMEGSFEPYETNGETVILTGVAPVSKMRSYGAEVAIYTRGQGRLFCQPGGYAPCKEAQAIIDAVGYEPENDTYNSPDSVFCSHGAGVIVPWYEVKEHAHMQSSLPRVYAEDKPKENTNIQKASSRTVSSANSIDDDELRAIFERTYGPIRNRGLEAFDSSKKIKRIEDTLNCNWVNADDYLLVDGYNIIFSWEDTSALARENLDAAREVLLNRLENYQGVCGCRLIVVFDAYKVKGGRRSVEERGKIHVVYTKEKETADMYIEKASYDLSHKHRVRVATSDGAEQIIILGHGSTRMSAMELLFEVEQAEEYIHSVIFTLGDKK